MARPNGRIPTFGPAGQLIATYSPDPDQNEGQAGLLNFYLTDWLGTRRATTDYAGNMQAACPSLPYGNGEGCLPTPAEHRFSGKERDTETGLDDFGARYYDSALGRFMTPDWDAKPAAVPYATYGDPQTLNLYAYVENGPVNRVDADGHVPAQSSGTQPNSCQGSVINNCLNGSFQADWAAKAGLTNATYVAQNNASAEHAAAATGSNAAPAQQQKTDNLSNVVENETSSLKPDPNAKPGQPGSAENLAAGQLAIAEVANRVIDAGHPDRVASSTLYDSEAAGLKRGDPAAVDAHNRSRTAAEAAVNGSNTTNGATQYRTRVGSNVTTPLGRSKTNPGTPVSMSFGPFIEGKHTVVIVVAP